MKAKLKWFAKNWPHYWKTIIASLPMVLYVGTEVYQAFQNASLDGLEPKDIVVIVIAGLTAVSVWAKQNAPLVEGD
jgi:hypothetical protein